MEFVKGEAYRNCVSGFWIFEGDSRDLSMFTHIDSDGEIMRHDFVNPRVYTWTKLTTSEYLEMLENTFFKTYQSLEYEVKFNKNLEVGCQKIEPDDALRLARDIIWAYGDRADRKMLRNV